jgi:hypothetical protein
MPSDDRGDKPDLTNDALNRRKMLPGSTTLAVASAIAATNAVQVAQAQQQPAAPAGGKKQNTWSSSAMTSASPTSAPTRSA